MKAPRTVSRPQEPAHHSTALALFASHCWAILHPHRYTGVLGHDPSSGPKAAAVLAKAMALICVRNTMLEELQAGRTPITRTGDYSDIRVIDADGREFT